MATVSPFSCDFIRRKCQHEEIFASSYLRTNRTNHTKIMRCFPHCCPDHRKRSYCGSAVFIQFEQSVQDPQAAIASEELVVYARFRPFSVAPLFIGDRVPTKAITSSLQRVDPSNGEWIESDLSHGNTKDGVVSWVFEVNASGRWYYPWSGAATIALRATEHVFEVLVFRREGDSQLELLTQTSSSKFRLMSFRRGMTTPASANAKEDDAEGSSDGSPRVKPKAQITPKAKKPTKKRARADASLVKKTLLPPQTKSANSSASESVSRAPSPANLSFAPPRLPPLRAASNGRSIGVSPLGTLLQWLHELPLTSSGTRRLRDWEQLVLDACAARQAAARGEEIGRELVPILSVLQVDSSPTRASTLIQNSASPLDVIDATLRTFIHLFLEVDGCHSGSVSSLFQPIAGRESVVRSHSAWLDGIERRARRFADARTNASWANLMATASTLHHQRAVSEVDETFGYRAFVAQQREQFARQQRSQIAHASKRARLYEHAPRSWLTADPRVWVSRLEDVSIEMDSMAQTSLTLLTAMQFWKQLSCLRLDYNAGTTEQPPQLVIASVFNTLVADQCFTRLILDGQNRWFNCLPSGDATTGTTLMGMIVGDYVGRATSAGTVHFTTYMWPSATATPSENLAYAWHWTSDVASLATSSTTLSVIVEAARVHHQIPQGFETMAIADKLRCVGRWDHVCQAQLVYHAQ